MTFAKRMGGALLFIAASCNPAEGEADRAAATDAGNAAAPAASPGQPRETVLRSETVEAVFTGWEVGDYVWANLEVKGREASGAWVGPTPLEHFLEAHRGQPITVGIETVRVHIPEAGGEQEVVKIADARAGTLTAAAWWQGLKPEQRQAAERRMEEVLGGG